MKKEGYIFLDLDQTLISAQSRFKDDEDEEDDEDEDGIFILFSYLFFIIILKLNKVLFNYKMLSQVIL